jgi:hypothetical protein
MTVKMVSFPLRLTDEMLAAISECVDQLNRDADRETNWTHAAFMRMAIAQEIQRQRRKLAKAKLERAAR